MKVAKAVPVSLLALALTVPVAWLSAQADAGSPSAEQATAAKLVYGILSDSRYAYRPRALDDTLSAEVFKRYLESLDPAKLFFTTADIDKLTTYRATLDDAIKSGEIAPAFEMFSLYQKRVDERVTHARGLLAKDIFAFDGKDRWEYDREDAPWVANTWR